MTCEQLIEELKRYKVILKFHGAGIWYNAPLDLPQEVHEAFREHKWRMLMTEILRQVSPESPEVWALTSRVLFTKPLPTSEEWRILVMGLLDAIASGGPETWEKLPAGPLPEGIEGRLLALKWAFVGDINMARCQN